MAARPAHIAAIPAGGYPVKAQNNSSTLRKSIQRLKAVTLGCTYILKIVFFRVFFDLMQRFAPKMFYVGRAWIQS